MVLLIIVLLIYNINYALLCHGIDYFKQTKNENLRYNFKSKLKVVLIALLIIGLSEVKC